MPQIDSYSIVRVPFPCDRAVRNNVVPGEMLLFVDSIDGEKAVKFRCPCGCGQMVYVPVNGEGHSAEYANCCWKLQLQGDIPTLTPSFLQLNGCKRHWFITNGKVVWC